MFRSFNRWPAGAVMRRPRLLILGGTAEARELARRTAESFEVITTLAGVLDRPARIPGVVLNNRFDGIDDLTWFLRDLFIDLVVDATHPYAATISAHARAACAAARVPRLQIVRPAWARGPGERWIEAATWEDAAERLPVLGRRAFLTVGARNLQAFAGRADCWFLVRLPRVPDSALPLPAHELITGLPPFRPADEIALMRTRRIGVLVTRNSGGASGHGKIEAARVLDLPILYVRRPDPEPGEVADSAEAALRWLGVAA